MTTSMQDNPRKLSKKEFNQIYWRSFTLLGSFNYERMEGLGFLYAMMPSLKRIWKDDPEGYKAALHRHIAAFNMTVAPSPFVMGIAVAMEELAHDNENFDVESIIASQGSILGPIILLLAFNIPNFLTRYYCLKIGYNNGSKLLENLQQSGKMQLFTYCAGIVGVAAIGCMIAAWIGLECPIAFTISGSEVVVQQYLDEICPQLLSLGATLLIYRLLKKKISIMKLILIIVVVAFICGVFGILA